MAFDKVNRGARHETILPFARYVAGPADYTTMIFTERRRDSTWAHQIACLAILHCPTLTTAAHPQNVPDNPAVDVIRSIKAVSDETIVLPDSKIGELSIFARRSGDMWILVVMSTGPARRIQVPLSFPGDGQYNALLVRDRKEKADAVALEDTAVQQGETLAIDLADGGAFVARFIR